MPCIDQRCLCRRICRRLQKPSCASRGCPCDRRSNRMRCTRIAFRWTTLPWWIEGTWEFCPSLERWQVSFQSCFSSCILVQSRCRDSPPKAWWSCGADPWIAWVCQQFIDACACLPAWLPSWAHMFFSEDPCPQPVKRSESPYSLYIACFPCAITKNQIWEPTLATRLTSFSSSALALFNSSSRAYISCEWSFFFCANSFYKRYASSLFLESISSLYKTSSCSFIVSLQVLDTFKMEASMSAVLFCLWVSCWTYCLIVSMSLW